MKMLKSLVGGGYEFADRHWVLVYGEYLVGDGGLLNNQVEESHWGRL